MNRKHFVPLYDSEVPIEHRETLAKYRRLAEGHGVKLEAPLCYLVQVADFTLKGDVPKIGPCREDFKYLQDWNFADTLTMEALVFWLPCPLSSNPAKTRIGHLELLVEVREHYNLPSHHLVGFGQASLVAGLVLAHYLATDERMLLSGRYVRTDTLISGDLQLSLGNFSASGLDCVYWDGFDESFDQLQVLALGIESIT